MVDWLSLKDLNEYKMAPFFKRIFSDVHEDIIAIWSVLNQKQKWLGLPIPDLTLSAYKIYCDFLLKNIVELYPVCDFCCTMLFWEISSGSSHNFESRKWHFICLSPLGWILIYKSIWLKLNLIPLCSLTIQWVFSN